MRSRATAIAATLALGTIPVGSSAAQEEERYTIERTENGYIRLDTTTGEMSLCRAEDGRLVCRMAEDQRSELEQQIAALTERVEALERKVEGRSALRNDLPTQEEFDRTMGLMERFIRRFFNMVEELNRDFDTQQEPIEPAPDRT